MIEDLLRTSNKYSGIIGCSGPSPLCCRLENQQVMVSTGCKRLFFTRFRENYDDVESELIEQDRAQEHVSSFVPQAYNMPRSYEAHRVSPAARTDHCEKVIINSGVASSKS